MKVKAILDFLIFKCNKMMKKQIYKLCIIASIGLASCGNAQNGSQNNMLGNRIGSVLRNSSILGNLNGYSTLNRLQNRMATIQFQNVTVTDWQQIGNKKVASGVKATFPTNVLSAGVSLQGFTASFGKSDYNLKDVGAYITNTSYLGTEVQFDATVELDDESNHNIQDATLQALIIANCE